MKKYLDKLWPLLKNKLSTFFTWLADSWSNKWQFRVFQKFSICAFPTVDTNEIVRIKEYFPEINSYTVILIDGKIEAVPASSIGTFGEWLEPKPFSFN